MLKIIRVTKEHLLELAPLFDAYRVFYKQQSDLDAALQFLKNRFENNQSIVFMAYVNSKPVGFVQLYTSYSSVSLKPLYILNDLYVDPSQRKKGIGEALLEKSKTYCVQNGYKGLALETALDNPAQKLYEKLGWKKDSSSFHYFWTPN